jgi:hypothetical protein
MNSVIELINSLKINIRKDKSFDATKNEVKDEQVEEILKDVANYFNHNISQVKGLYEKLYCNIIGVIKVEMAMKDKHIAFNPTTKEEIDNLLNTKISEKWNSSSNDNFLKKILIHVLNKR